MYRVDFRFAEGTLTSGWTYLIVGIYALILIALAVYGINFFYLTLRAPRARRKLVEQPLPDQLPIVTVQLPIYNEQLVAERVIDAAARLDWPRDRLEIQVLDDSTDVTCEIAAHAVARWQTAGVNIKHIHRAQRDGYKAGALSAGLAQARGEFMAIFDADFVPAPDFLRRTIGMFRDPAIGFVQARWDHLNRDTSLLTYLQALSLDGHFMIEQAARVGSGLVMNFNGTAGVWRCAAIVDAGDWSAGSLNEDMDLSYRAALRGWKPAYLPEVTVPCELVPSIIAYRRQQARWAQGSLRCARHLLPQIMRSRLSIAAKLEALLHLTGYSIQVLMLLISVIYPLLMMTHIPDGWRTALFWFGLGLTPMALAPALLIWAAQRSLRPDRSSAVREIGGLIALSTLWAGLVLNSTRALWRGLQSQPVVFERTPKSGLTAGRTKRRSIDRLPGDRLIFVEFALAIFNGYSAMLAWQAHNIGIFISAAIFAIGLTTVAGAVVWEMRGQWRPDRYAAREPARSLPEPVLSVASFDRPGNS